MEQDFNILTSSLDDIGDYLLELKRDYEDSRTFIKRKVGSLDDLDMSVLSPYIKDLEDFVKKAADGHGKLIYLRDTHVMNSDYSYSEGHCEVHTWLTSLYIIWHGPLPTRDLTKTLLRTIRENEGLL